MLSPLESEWQYHHPLRSSLNGMNSISTSNGSKEFPSWWHDRFSHGHFISIISSFTLHQSPRSNILRVFSLPRAECRDSRCLLSRNIGYSAVWVDCWRNVPPIMIHCCFIFSFRWLLYALNRDNVSSSIESKGFSNLFLKFLNASSFSSGVIFSSTLSKISSATLNWICFIYLFYLLCVFEHLCVFALPLRESTAFPA